MPEETFKKIIDELAELHFTGRISPHSFNEPLLDQRLSDLLSYTHNKIPGAKVVLYTNGDFLDEKVLENLYASGVRNYLVSIHGQEDERKRNALRIRKLKDYCRAKGWGIKIGLLVIGAKTPLSTRAGLVSIRKEQHKERKRCSFYTNPLVINYKGDVVLCCEDYLGSVVFGNVFNEKIIDIWRKPQFISVRKQLKKGIYTLDICKKCV